MDHTTNSHEDSELQLHVPDEYVSFDGLSLLWIDGVLLVPAIFGVMFLPPTPRLIVLGIGIAAVAALSVTYFYARVHPDSAAANLLHSLGIKARPKVHAS